MHTLEKLRYESLYEKHSKNYYIICLSNIQILVVSLKDIKGIVF